MFIVSALLIPGFWTYQQPGHHSYKHYGYRISFEKYYGYRRSKITLFSAVPVLSVDCISLQSIVWTLEYLCYHQPSSIWSPKDLCFFRKFLNTEIITSALLYDVSTLPLCLPNPRNTLMHACFRFHLLLHLHGACQLFAVA